MNWGVGLVAIFIVPDVTASYFVQIINMGETGPYAADWITISSEVRRQHIVEAQPVCLLSAMLRKSSHELKFHTFTVLLKIHTQTRG